jgi:predicted nucleic acid-binding protein
MAVLVDTNILVRSVQPHHSLTPVAENAIAVLTRTDEPLTIAVQNLIEFWVVATRPARENGLGMTAEFALRELARFKELFQVLPESDRILPEWERLVSSYRVSGKNAHDARLVAVMNVNRVDKILTFDSADFLRFKEIQVLDPHLVR